jgi:4-diphosphocytidyl-2-C-methyl-D-erythritol kinase
VFRADLSRTGARGGRKAGKLPGFDKHRYIGIIAASMAASVRIAAPAKVNLHLRVYARRSDGYHGIRSLFQAVSLCDEIVIRSLKSPDAVDIDGDFDCPPEKTTVHAAVMAFRRITGIRSGVSISVDKHIPAGAGLGGGSSDAASVLRALDALHGTGLSRETLAKAGASVGSDVPFFFAPGAALVTGRGEEVEDIGARVDFSVALVFPGFPVGTAEAYSLLDRSRPDDSLEADPGNEEIERGYRNRPEAWPFANSFEAWVGAAHPRILGLRDSLVRMGASFAAMSGSGSTVFGVFEDGALCGRACSMLAAEGVDARSVAPLARLPELH